MMGEETPSSLAKRAMDSVAAPERGVSRPPRSEALWTPIKDDQIVPYADAAPLLLKNGTLKTYKDFPHGMPAREAATINADLLAFIKS